MKAKLFIVVALALLPITPAVANDQGAWVKVDSQGNAISGPIVCTSDVCGNPNSLYNQMTLGVGERYVLQFAADPITGNVAGIGNNNPGVDVKVDLQTNEWTTTRTNNYEIASLYPTGPKIAKSEKVTETWQSGAQTSERITKVEPITVEPKTQTRILDWTFLMSLDFDDLLKWFVEYLKGISLS